MFCTAVVFGIIGTSLIWTIALIPSLWLGLVWIGIAFLTIMEILILVEEFIIKPKTSRNKL